MLDCAISRRSGFRLNIPMTQTISTQHQLFGPVDFNSALSYLVRGDAFYWPGSCDTAHIAVFQVELGMAPIVFATWRMAFMQPAGRTIFRCVACLDGPTNLVELGRIDSDDMPPGINVWNAACPITAPLNAFFAQYCGQECNVGWQICGDNTHPFVVYSSRLELTWQVG